ncbi:MAG: DUF1549 domain-containing protein, partial [Acidobacteria bacterium]|nr:DUF1549 domain-containing protein [Acidobacteriota bacterium]
MLLRLLLALPVSVFAAEPPAAVKTLLAEKCGACHNDTAKASDFTLSAVAKGGKKFGRAIVGGHPEQSVLVRMIRGEMAPRMPLGGTLSAAEISLIEGWVRSLPAERAHDKEEWRWPYEKPVKTAPPPGGTNAVDGFVLARLQAAGLRLAPPAAPATLARRVYLDLIGLPPSPEELRAFVEDRSPDAYAKMIERLLADPRYGERWGRHWLDLVRYGETSGLEGDGAIGNAWRYRDWVIDAFNHDMPYDRFVMQQLAGADEHSMTRNNYSPNIQGHVPLGFLRVAPWDRSNLVAGEVRQNYLNEVTTTVGSVFLGLSVGCARCHDHKYDPIPQRDFYRLQAFFNAIQVENVDVPFKDPEFRAKAEAKRKEIQDRLANGPEKKALDEFETAALPRYRAARKEAAKGKKLVVDDLRLELRRKDSSVFSEAERRRHADLLEDANRTLDPGEAAALDKFEAALLPRMEKAGLERFDVLGVEELRGELGRSTSKIFDTGERNKHRDLSEALEVLRRRAGRWS